MSHSIESLSEHQLETGMIVLGADTALVGEVLSLGRDIMLVVRRPLPAIKLPLDLIAAIVDGVALLTVTADAADSIGEIDEDLLSSMDPVAV